MGVLRIKVGGQWVDVGVGGGSLGGLEAARPAASTLLAGFHYFATDTKRDWLCDGTAWSQAAGVMPRFRLLGGGAGQSTASGWVVDTWGGAGSSDPLAMTAAGVFTCPVSHPGRWRFDYEISIQAWNTGIRQAALQANIPAATNFAYQSTASVNSTMVNMLASSAEIVLAAGQTVRMMSFQDAGTLAVNADTSTYFQGQFVGPV
jgi:hypothetical protein